MTAPLTLSEVVRLPAPWVLLVALLVGAALSVATRRIPRARGEVAVAAARDVLVARKWVRVSLLLSVAVVAALVAVFLPGPDKIYDLKYPLFVVAAGVVFGALFRFPRTLGLLGAIVLLALTVTLALFASAWTPYQGDTAIATVAVYAAGEDEMDIEVRELPEANQPETQRDAPHRYPPAYVRLQGPRFVPLVRTAHFDDLWPVLGWRGWYRISGYSGVGSVTYRYPGPPGIAGTLYTLFLRHAGWVPGARLVRSEASPTTGADGLQVLESYTMILSADGAVSLVGSEP